MRQIRWSLSTFKETGSMPFSNWGVHNLIHNKRQREREVRTAPSIFVRNDGSMLTWNRLMVKHEVTSMKLPPKNVPPLIQINLIKNLTILQDLKIIHTGSWLNCPIWRLPSRLSTTNLCYWWCLPQQWCSFLCCWLLRDMYLSKVMGLWVWGLRLRIFSWWVVASWCWSWCRLAPGSRPRGRIYSDWKWLQRLSFLESVKTSSPVHSSTHMRTEPRVFL